MTHNIYTQDYQYKICRLILTIASWLLVRAKLLQDKAESQTKISIKKIV